MFIYKKRQSSAVTKEGKRLWYPMVVSSREVVTTRKLARELSARSGDTEGDVIGILHDLGNVMREHLSAGRRVVLDGIGSFKISAQAKGNGVEDPETVSARQFNHIKVFFTPESRSSGALGRKDVTLISSEIQFRPASAQSSAVGNEGGAGTSDDGSAGTSTS